MTLPLTLPTEALEHPAMDYATLRREGIRLLERLGGQLWTDFNAHDPGITILEQVCYAITDLAYRANYDIKDILASGGGDPYRSIHTPGQVLTTNPVTLLDLRKLLIDVPGVKNAWLEAVEESEPRLLHDPAEKTIYLQTPARQPPHRAALPLRGLYRVLLEADSHQSFQAAEILPEAQRRLQTCRSLGEDFLPPTILPGQAILVNAKIEISAVDDPESLLARVYYAIGNAISPRIRFRTLTEMLALGKRMDEIMDGPSLQHGFLDDAALEKLQRKLGLRTSDLIQEVMNLGEVLTVSSINLQDDASREDWYLKLDPLRAPYFDAEKSLFQPQGPGIRLTRAGIPVQVNPGRVSELLKSLHQADIQPSLPELQRDVRLAAGEDRNLSSYYSIQNQFPATYGIGSIGLPDSASPQRKAQARQLKAYLMFFDQLLANYFAQLGNAKDLFSFESSTTRTYFSQTIQETGLGLDGLRDPNLEAHAARLQEMTEISALGLQTRSPNNPRLAERKNRFLNHLLARFAEQFTDYSLLLYAHISDEKLIEDKAAFLRDYHQIGATRGSGFNYAQTSWESENLSGLEKRISRKLGISSRKKRALAEISPEDPGGFHVIEHLLLRPSLADKEQWAQAPAGVSWQASAFMAEPINSDPYSHQISFVFPKWVARFAEPGFSDLIAKTLREETPAHLHIYLHWLEQEPMRAFEDAYKTWLDAVIAGTLWEPAAIRPSDPANHSIHIRLRDARDRMAQALGLGIPYPLRDLKLVYLPMVAYNRPTEIQILGGQTGVTYQLCDEDGNPIIANKQTFETSPENSNGATLPTPAIVKDISFTILAIREDKTRGIRLESYLNQPISIKVGIDTSLPTRFIPAKGQVAGENSLIINYAETVSVTVERTQEGISYKLVTGPQDALISISAAVKGNQSAITLVSTQAFNEDTPIRVQAYRTASASVSALLDATLTVLVRPNPATAVSATPPIVNYNASAKLKLENAQASVEYCLFKRELTPSEYQPATKDNLALDNGEGQQIFIQKPANADGFGLVGVFESDFSLSTGKLTEDTLFIIQATKIDNRESLQLTQALVVLTRPNTAPPVGALAETIPAGESGVVTVEKTQPGVHYQLRLDSDNSLVNLPGYHQTDRGVESIRVEVDLVVETQGEAILLLPTQAINGPTTFNVLARKTLSGVTAQLKGKATLGNPA